MGDKAYAKEAVKLWDRLRAAARKHGLVTSCVVSGHRCQSYGLWQMAPHRERPAEFWHPPTHLRAASGMFRARLGTVRDHQRHMTLEGVAYVTLEAPQWT